MATNSEQVDLGSFTEDVVSAIYRALDSRAAGRSSDDLTGRITVGMWLDPKPTTDPTKQPDPAQPQGPGGTDKSLRMNKRQLAALTSRGALNRESVGRLNDIVGADPQVGIQLLRTVAEDPLAWAEVFQVDDDQLANLRAVSGDEAYSRFMEHVVMCVAAFENDLESLTLDIRPSTGGIAKAESKPAKDTKPAWMPDKIEVKVEGSGQEAKGTITVTWEL